MLCFLVGFGCFWCLCLCLYDLLLVVTLNWIVMFGLCLRVYGCVCWLCSLRAFMVCGLCFCEAFICGGVLACFWCLFLGVPWGCIVCVYCTCVLILWRLWVCCIMEHDLLLLIDGFTFCVVDFCFYLFSGFVTVLLCGLPVRLTLHVLFVVFYGYCLCLCYLWFWFCTSRGCCFWQVVDVL